MQARGPSDPWDKDEVWTRWGRGNAHLLAARALLDVIADGPLVSEAAHQAVRATDEALGVPLKDVLLGVVGGRRLGQQLWIRVPLQRGDHGQSATTHHVLWHQAVPSGEGGRRGDGGGGGRGGGGGGGGGENGGLGSSAEIGTAVVNAIRAFNRQNGPANIAVA